MIIQNVEYLWSKGYWNLDYTLTTHCDQEVPHLALLGPDRVHLLLQAHLHLTNQRRVLPPADQSEVSIHLVPHPVPRAPPLPRHQARRGDAQRALGLLDAGLQLVPAAASSC